jgi:hypothetical protein
MHKAKGDILSKIPKLNDSFESILKPDKNGEQVKQASHGIVTEVKAKGTVKVKINRGNDGQRKTSVSKAPGGPFSGMRKYSEPKN